MDKPKVLVIGSINMDLCLKISRTPSAGESLIGETYHYIPGGKGANQAVAAAKLGAEVTFVGKVGDDATGKELADSLKSIGVDTEYLYKASDTSSGLAVVILEETGQNRILVYPGSNMELTTEDIDKAFQKAYDAMIIQFEIPQEVVIHACHLAAERGIPFIVDAGPAQNFPIEEISGAEILTPNETETYAMCQIDVTDITSAKTASEVLMKRSKARYVVIKAGESGAFIYDGNEIKQYEAFKVDPVDTTAAGDAFTGAMAVVYAGGGDIEEAVCFANAVGAVTVKTLGAQPSIPARSEVDAFLNRGC